MPRANIGPLALHYVEHGSGDNVVLAVHGNLGCYNWLDLALPLFPKDVRVIAVDWRGCGDSDKPEPTKDYSNYSMDTHARDMVALLDTLGIGNCNLYGHSTGGIIIAHMLLMQPERFKKVLLLDPVTPLGLQLAPGQVGVITQMKGDPDIAFAGLSSAAPTLFRPETMVAGQMPQFADMAAPPQRELFKTIIEKTKLLSDGIWFGTPHNLALEWDSGKLAAKMPEMRHEMLVLYGKLDYWIPREHVDTMVAKLPNAKLEVFPYVGHSMNLEQPFLFARIFSDYFRSAPEAGATG